MMGAPFRSILFLLPLAAFAAAKPVKFSFNPTNELKRTASIYIVPENRVFYRLCFPNGKSHRFTNEDAYSAKPSQKLTSSKGWIGNLRTDDGQIEVHGVITFPCGTNVVGAAVGFLFKDGRLLDFRIDGKSHTFDYEETRELTQQGPPTAKKNALADKILKRDDEWTDDDYISRCFDLIHVDGNEVW